MTTHTQLLVNAPDKQYPVIIGENVLETLPALLAERQLNGKIGIVTNETLAPRYGKMLADCLKNATLATVPDGEQHWRIVSKMQRWRLCQMVNSTNHWKLYASFTIPSSTQDWIASQ